MQYTCLTYALNSIAIIPVECPAHHRLLHLLIECMSQIPLLCYPNRIEIFVYDVVNLNLFEILNVSATIRYHFYKKERNFSEYFYRFCDKEKKRKKNQKLTLATIHRYDKCAVDLCDIFQVPNDFYVAETYPVRHYLVLLQYHLDQIAK